MSHWICCNSCFNTLAADRKLAVTSCGHIICNVCFHKGKEGECLICKAKCQLSPLSDKSSSEVKALFLDVNSVATKYFSEISKVLQFQARHQKRLLAHYKQRNGKLEEVLLKMKQEMQQMAKKITEQKAYISKLESTLQHQSTRVASQSNRSSHSLSLLKPALSVPQICCSSSKSLSQNLSTSSLVENIERNTRGPFRKPEISVSVPRISLISPPKDGQMGTVSHRATHQNTIGSSFHWQYGISSALRDTLRTQSPNLASCKEAPWEMPVLKLPTAYRYPSMSSLGPPP
ncbi:LOW QUALITY PROTEIN: putative E3 SUMO-protein ligase RNF212 [Chanos chanos]|uniref:LOW QUALITY PROTEIN: putative E3 SUMO-protein ligase RNF212 n=1 Tax=Chanos chanos TaxID=29144 RepID=A0A6J2UQY0_CHACN|nr:LOW QUALITY PROTEIN: probable E3 SUMO-protein ligase RNF212 [Chanos chanos]